MNAFEEYARWMSPIGMSPRRIAQPHTYAGFKLQPEDRVFLCFSSANRDEDHLKIVISMTLRAMWGLRFRLGRGHIFAQAPGYPRQ